MAVVGLEGLVENNRKTFLPDTNVLVNNPAAIWILSGNADVLPLDEYPGQLQVYVPEHDRQQKEPNNIIIPSIVEWELDHLRKDDQRPFPPRQAALLARNLLSYLRRESETHSLFSDTAALTLPNGALVLGVKHEESAFLEWAKDLYEPNRDDRILWAIEQAVAKYGKDLTDFKGRIRFISEDQSFRDKVFEAGFSADSFHYEQIKDPHQRYTGIYRRVVSSAVFRELSSSRGATIVDLGIAPEELSPNQVVALFPKSDVPEKASERIYFVNRVNNPAGVLDSLVHYDWFQQQMADQSWTRSTTPQRKPVSLEQKFDFFRSEDHERLKHALLNAPFCDRKLKRDLERQDYEIKTQEEMNTLVRRLRKGFKKENRERGGETENENKVLYLPLNRTLVPDREQKVLVDLLADDAIPVVSVEASHGSGKTLFSVLVGLLKVNERLYNGLLYMRPMKTVGEDLGTLPGDKEKKMSRFMIPIVDALEEIFGYHDKQLWREKEAIRRQIEHLQSHECVNYEVAADIGGRTLRKQYIIVDEAHLYTRGQLNMILQRVGRGSKMVFLGDLKQIESFINTPGMVKFLNERTSGFAHLSEKLKGEPLYAHLALPPSLIKRSDAAALALKL